jgi:hypothetical protein
MTGRGRKIALLCIVAFVGLAGLFIVHDTWIVKEPGDA